MVKPNPLPQMTAQKGVISTVELSFICAKMNRRRWRRFIKKRSQLRQGKMLIKASEVMLIGALALFAVFALSWGMPWL